MAITVNCPSCRVRLNVTEDRAGSRLDCPRCDAVLTVPRATATAAPAVERAPPPVPKPQILSLPSVDLDELEPPPAPPRLTAPRRASEPPRAFDRPARSGPRSRTLILAAAGVFGAVLLVGSTVLAYRALRKPAEDAAKDAPAQPLTPEQVYQRLMRSAVLISSPHGDGSGFVADDQKRLVVTNFHVVGAQREVAVLFPVRDGNGAVVATLDEYAKRVKEKGAVVKGEVLARETSCDLALIRVERLPDDVRAAPLSPSPAPTASSVYSVGGSGTDNNLLWRFTKGTVRGRSPHKAAVDFGTIDCMILETDAPVNPGDSGGAVMNEFGNVVAVVSHGSVKLRLVSGNIDADAVRGFLSRHAPK